MVIIGPIEHADDGLVYKSDDVQLKIGDQILSNGTLLITESSLSWKPVNSNDSLSIPWPEIGVQAVSNNPVKCIYFMLDNAITWPGVYDPGARANGNDAAAHGDGGALAENNDSDEDEGNESDCEPDMTELWLIPSDSNTVDLIFQSMTECQALHPDPSDSISEDEGEFMEDEDADEPQQEVGQENMRNLNLNEDRFADADED